MAGWFETPLFDAHTNDFYWAAGTWPLLDEALVGDDELHEWQMGVSSLSAEADGKEARAW